jgi:hypothetical protein
MLLLLRLALDFNLQFLKINSLKHQTIGQAVQQIQSLILQEKILMIGSHFRQSKKLAQRDQVSSKILFIIHHQSPHQEYKQLNKSQRKFHMILHNNFNRNFTDNSNSLQLFL